MTLPLCNGCKTGNIQFECKGSHRNVGAKLTSHGVHGCFIVPAVGLHANYNIPSRLEVPSYFQPITIPDLSLFLVNHDQPPLGWGV